jgi:CMP-N,N'-diacetyllegionaminic acid synthase
MIAGRRVLAVVPARGGSKGLPRKNLREIDGIPLVGHAGRCASAVTEIDRAVVSTDDEEIVAAAERFGLDAPFRRPAPLSGDRIGDFEVLEHALAAVEELDAVTYDLVVMLQPTSPSRRPEQVRAALEMTVAGGWDSVWTVSPTDPKYHPDKQLRVTDGQHLEHLTERGRSIIARQQLSTLYHRNGIAYVLTRSCLVDQRTILGARAGALVIDEPVANIDTELDLAWAAFLLGRDATISDGP